jgi:hypothetical protein
LQVPAYQWFEAQLGAASGDYAAADQALGECLEVVSSNLPIWPALQRLDVVPPGYGQGKPASMGTFCALLTGHLLLQKARMAKLPWQLDDLIQCKILPPHIPRLPGWWHTLNTGVNFVVDARRPQADVWAIRAWLSLEAGHTKRAREQAINGLAVGAQMGENRYRLLYESHAAVLRVLDLTSRGGLSFASVKK